MEPASHARIDPATVEGLEDVFVLPDTPSHLSNSHAHQMQAQKPSHFIAAPVARSEAQQSTEQALACVRAIAGCLDVRSEAVIEHHTICKSPKNKKKKKTVEEWRIKWSAKKSDVGNSGTSDSLSELASVDPHGRGLFDHVSELLSQNSQLIAKLEAATYRIGYLEAELESLRNQAGYSDCDAQVAEFPLARPAIRAINEMRKANFRGSTPDSQFSSAPDFWDEGPVGNGSDVPFKKMEEEPLQVETVKKQSREEPGISNTSNESSVSSVASPIGIFNWLPPRA